MRDRTRRFTVGPGTDPRQVNILAANPSTKAWAANNSKLLGYVLATLADTLRNSAVVMRPRPASILPEGVESMATMAMRLTELLRRGFPTEKFDVVPETSAEYAGG